MTKGPFRKQAIVSIPNRYTDKIMEDAGNYIHLINTLLKNIKSNLHTEFIHPCTGGIFIATNNIPAFSNLNIIERYIKSIDSIDYEEVLSSQLPQSKSYLKIMGIPFVQPNSSNLSSSNITNTINCIGLFESISLVSKPRVIKASPKSNMAIIWINI